MSRQQARGPPIPQRPLHQQLKILSANVRGLRTNIGELTHLTLKNNADIIITCETFLNSEVEETFGKIRGYTHWIRRDRQGREGGGIAVCHKNNLQIQVLEVNCPTWLEVIFLKVVLSTNNALLLCAHYRPQWQGRAPLDFLSNNLDGLLLQYNCQHIAIVGDLNYHLVQSAYDDLLAVNGLVDHVDFPTHILGGTLDPVITDISHDHVKCSSLGKVGSSDHFAIIAHICLAPAKEENKLRKIWLWDQTNWTAMKEDLAVLDWNSILTGDANSKATALTDCIIKMQEKYVPSRTYTTRPGDQPWFGYRCRLAADCKYKSWKKYKNNPTLHNRALYKNACKAMIDTSKWAQQRWHRDLQQELSGPGVGSKSWWALAKDTQGKTPENTIPPLNKADGTIASSNIQKAELLASMFSSKMMVPDPDRTPPQTRPLCDYTLTNINVCHAKVLKLLKTINTKKATGPDNVSPHILRQCAVELAEPLTALFQTCIEENCWPRIWKEARVVPIHKKLSKANPQNYRPISLLSIISKMFEKIIAEDLLQHLEDHNLLSNKQFGFRSSRSTTDLLLLLAKNWQDEMDAGNDTLVVALDIAGAFDRVWHRGLVAKLYAKGIQGDLLDLLKDYLTARTLRVVVAGHGSQQYPVEASVPQGSVLGPILWNIYIDDLLQEHPEISAYADDCTISISYRRENHAETIRIINNKLNALYEWGTQWQVNFAANKTQAMVISRSSNASSTIGNQIKMDDTALILQNHISILGAEIDEQLRFDRHINKICQVASFKLSSLRRLSKFLDSRGIMTLFKAQVRPHLEYASLAWSSCCQTQLRRLDKIQERALRLTQHDPSPPQLDTLEHRRDVGALTVFHKAQVLQVPHLASLRLPPRSTMRSTRTVLSGRVLVEVPRSRSSQHLRTFSARTARLWNQFTAMLDVSQMSTQQVKTAAHQWRSTQPTPLPLYIM